MNITRKDRPFLEENILILFANLFKLPILWFYWQTYFFRIISISVKLVGRLLFEGAYTWKGISLRLIFRGAFNLNLPYMRMKIWATPIYYHRFYVCLAFLYFNASNIVKSTQKNTYKYTVSHQLMSNDQKRPYSCTNASTSLSKHSTWVLDKKLLIKIVINIPLNCWLSSEYEL